jgi:hypothetical protein
MAGLPSLLTAVLLRAAPSCTPAEARPERLPPNFVQVGCLVVTRRAVGGRLSGGWRAVGGLLCMAGRSRGV